MCDCSKCTYYNKDFHPKCEFTGDSGCDCKCCADGCE